METQNVFQIVGFSNSGKTTLMEKLIKKGTKLGYKVGTVKHHGHGGSPEKMNSEKDSDIHHRAGAHISAVEGDGNIHLEISIKNGGLTEILKFYEHFPLDLVLIEGYKHAVYPKVVLIRHQDDVILLEKLENIKAVISWIPLELEAEFDVYMIQDSDLFVEVFFARML